MDGNRRFNLQDNLATKRYSLINYLSNQITTRRENGQDWDILSSIQENLINAIEFNDNIYQSYLIWVQDQIPEFQESDLNFSIQDQVSSQTYIMN